MAAAVANSSTTMRCVFDGCIAAADTEVRRRPYHRNCSCALHRNSGRGCAGTCNSRLSYAVDKRSQYCKRASVVATLSPPPLGDLAEIKGERISKHKEKGAFEIGAV